MKPKLQYEYGLIWIPAGNPLGLKKGYYSQEQINKALDKSPEKAAAFHKFMEK